MFCVVVATRTRIAVRSGQVSALGCAHESSCGVDLVDSRHVAQFMISPTGSCCMAEYCEDGSGPD
jgi:hypothetical protein